MAEENLEYIPTQQDESAGEQQLVFDYFYGEQADMFSFYRIPKILFTHEKFKDISTEAKVLYGLFLDRMNLSAKNGWKDEQGRVYIIFTVEEIQEALQCKNQKVAKLFSELEQKSGLIERKWQGFGMPPLIMVKNFISSTHSSCVQPNSEYQPMPCENHTTENVKITSRISETSHHDECENHMTGNVIFTRRKSRKSHDDECEIHTARNVKNAIQESRKSHTNNTDISNTDLSDTDSSDTDIVMDRLIAGVHKKIDYPILEFSYGHDPREKDALDTLVLVVVETLATKNPRTDINGQIWLTGSVKELLLNINNKAAVNVIERYLARTDKVRSPKKYLLTAIVNELYSPTPEDEQDEE